MFIPFILGRSDFGGRPASSITVCSLQLLPGPFSGSLLSTIFLDYIYRWIMQFIGSLQGTSILLFLSLLCMKLLLLLNEVQWRETLMVKNGATYLYFPYTVQLV